MITGITGQDGCYLADLLLGKGYEVHGIIRRASTFNTARIDHLYADPHINGVRLFLHYGDLSRFGELGETALRIEAGRDLSSRRRRAMCASASTFQNTPPTSPASARCAFWRRFAKTGIQSRFYQASCSEMFGKVQAGAADGDDALLAAQPVWRGESLRLWATVNYRESYGLRASNGILFNHESPRRGETFVTRKITRAVAAIKHGLQNELFLGNLDAKRDWGYATEYVEGMWRMLQQTKAMTTCSRRTKPIRSANSSRSLSAASISTGRNT